MGYIELVSGILASLLINISNLSISKNMLSKAAILTFFVCFLGCSRPCLAGASTIKDGFAEGASARVASVSGISARDIFVWGICVSINTKLFGTGGWLLLIDVLLKK